MNALHDHRRTVRTLFLALAVFAGCVAPAFASIHAGDKVNVTVYDHPELTGEQTVGSDGYFDFPLIGRVQAAGLDPSTIADRIQRRLAAYVIKPAVEVKLQAAGDAAFVTGGQAGTIVIRPGETLLVALADAKVPDSAGLDRVALVRDGRVVGNYDVIKMRASGSDGPQIEPGDVIRVPTRPIDVQVVGAVKTSGNVYLEANEPLGDAIQQAGAGDDANLNNIELQRGGTVQYVTLGGDVMLAPAQPGDKLIVPQSELVEVIGAVLHPGVVALKTDTSLVSALYLAGGPTEHGDLRNVRIVHRGNAITNVDMRKIVKGDLTQDPTLADGDIVFISEQHGLDFRYIIPAVYFLLRFFPR